VRPGACPRALVLPMGAKIQFPPNVSAVLRIKMKSLRPMSAQLSSSASRRQAPLPAARPSRAARAAKPRYPAPLTMWALVYVVLQLRMSATHCSTAKIILPKLESVCQHAPTEKWCKMVLLGADVARVSTAHQDRPAALARAQEPLPRLDHIWYALQPLGRRRSRMLASVPRPRLDRERSAA
jgi:hypothetical protein